MLKISEKTIAWWQGQSISSAVFLEHVHLIAATLPQQPYAINLCEDRYLFLVTFAAVLVRGQTNLLPSSLANMELQRIAGDYSESYCLTERHITALPLKQHIVSLPSSVSITHTGAIPKIVPEHIAAIVFTSGSTGQSSPHIKRWRTLVAISGLLTERYNIQYDTSIVATVPPQHMYGLETSILLPLIMGVPVHGGRPFFPIDICEALATVPTPRILITTPVHLDACVKSDLKWPDIECIISATSPLSKTLATQAEEVFQTRVLEIYGCTEGGSLASKRTTLDGEIWSLYDGIHISKDNLTVTVHSDHFSEPVILNDVIKIHSETQFELLGRQTDMIKIAGKRASLGNLNHKLHAIEGVEDGVFIMPEDGDKGVTRLTALVVAPNLDEKSILAALAQRIDSAFLPRPLYKVNQLPRNETGKLPRRILLALLTQLRQKKRKSK